MSRTLGYAMVSLFLLASCAVYPPSYLSPYGARIVLYGDGRHPGVDWLLSPGTPVVATSDGDVTVVGYTKRWGGYYVRVSHSEHFDSWYVHLVEAHVQMGQSVSRGQPIGLSGADYKGIQYLHFGICKKGGSCAFFSDTHDPADYWLGGKPQCFDPQIDYSRHSQREITVPVACGRHSRELVARAKEKVQASPSEATDLPEKTVTDIASLAGTWNGTGFTRPMEITINRDGAWTNVPRDGWLVRGRAWISGGGVRVWSSWGRYYFWKLHEGGSRRVLIWLDDRDDDVVAAVEFTAGR